MGETHELLRKILAVDTVNLEIWDRIGPQLAEPSLFELSSLSFDGTLLTAKFKSKLKNFPGFAEIFEHVPNRFKDEFPTLNYFSLASVVENIGDLLPEKGLPIAKKLLEAVEKCQVVLGAQEQLLLDTTHTFHKAWEALTGKKPPSHPVSPMECVAFSRRSIDFTLFTPMCWETFVFEGKHFELLCLIHQQLYEVATTATPSPSIFESKFQLVDASKGSTYDSSATNLNFGNGDCRIQFKHPTVIRKLALSPGFGEAFGGNPVETLKRFNGAVVKLVSTTLAVRLKHNASSPSFYDLNSPFVDAGKELCWTNKMLHVEQFWSLNFPACINNSNNKVFALDGCPRYQTENQARVLRCTDPSIKLIWLVRDPIERLISEVNDPSSRRGVSRSATLTQQLVDDYVCNHMHLTGLSGYTNLLNNLNRSFPLNQVLMVVSEFQDFDNLTLAQQSIDFIMDWLEGPHIPAFLTRSNHRSKQDTYIVPTAAARAKAQALWHNPVHDFFDRIGKRIPWPNFLD